ncbi:ANTAR domain-containing response regulator [Caloranaerobacter azorensis]|uniref:ANTAR domain-containing protein n=1 Tax=Caloranaerobacter azorensis TaxID=116090 RepID=A0A6P1YCL5_9FIRM|nr:ANTAR domain-containing protein [Caloranaerobacter azorensis]QIB26951.1 ANTAR domain-containing protein [Caloranaerobacter azorensis]
MIRQGIIVVVSSNDKIRNIISGLLKKRGYSIYEASDGASAIRLARSLKPHLVLMDFNLVGAGAYNTARIIEDDNLSSVIFITSNPNKNFIELLKNMTIYAYITIPINPSQLYQIVEFSLINSSKIKELKIKVDKLENKLRARKKIEKAKGIIMRMYNISEDEAYTYMRKKSMDRCITMERLAEEILKDKN